jgi:hypothetical protein
MPTQVGIETATFLHRKRARNPETGVHSTQYLESPLSLACARQLPQRGSQKSAAAGLPSQSRCARQLPQRGSQESAAAGLPSQSRLRETAPPKGEPRVRCGGVALSVSLTRDSSPKGGAKGNASSCLALWERCPRRGRRGSPLNISFSPGQLPVEIVPRQREPDIWPNGWLPAAHRLCASARMAAARRIFFQEYFIIERNLYHENPTQHHGDERLS